MSVSPALTGRIERCTGTHHMSYLAQRPREQLLKAKRSRTNGDFTHPQSPAAASSSALTHTCRDNHTYWGYKKFGNMQNTFNRELKADEKFTITVKKFQTSVKNNKRMTREPLLSQKSRRKGSSMHTVRHTPAM